MPDIKILIISQYYPPDITAAAFRIGELVNYLRENENFEVTVVTTTPHKFKTLDNNIYDTNNINRINISSKKHIFQYIEFIFKSRRILKNLGEFDWVFYSSPPFFLQEVVRTFYNRSKVFLDIRDIWPESAVAAGKLRNKLIYKFFKNYEKRMYQKADQISVVSKPMANYISGIMVNKPVTIAYNGISSKDLQLIGKKKSAKDYKNNPFKIFYAGNLGLLQGLEVIPESILQLRSQYNIEFHFIGNGAKKESLQKMVNNLGCKKIFFHDPLKRGDLLVHLLGNADALFINLKKHWILEKTIPSKVFDYLLLGKPVICGIKGEGREIFEKTGGTVFFEQESSTSLSNATKKLYNNYNELDLEASINMPEMAKNFIREDQYSKISEVLSSC